MAATYNLEEALLSIAEGKAEEVVQNYRETRFRKPAILTTGGIKPFVERQDLSFGFALPFYYEFLDQGTRFITKDPFITPVIEDLDNSTESAISVAFEQDITDALDLSFGDANITQI